MSRWMMEFFLIGSGTVLLLWILSRGSIYVHIRYIKEGKRDQLLLQVFLFNWIKIYQMRRDAAIASFIEQQIKKFVGGKKETAGKKEEKSFSLKSIRLNYTKLFLFHFICRKFYCRIKLASENAAETAVAFGALNSVKSTVLRWLECRATFQRRPEILIVPDFQGRNKEIFFQCIVSAKIGHIIHMLKNFM